MKILVTGSQGFIGKYLINKLKEKGFSIFEFNIKLDNRMDIMNRDFLLKYFSAVKPNIVIHLAANANTARAYKDPYFDFKINVLGTINVLKHVKRNPSIQLIFTSSAYVYGELSFVPITESHPTNPSHPYGLSKLTAECYIETHHAIFGISYTVFRLFNV